MDKNTTDKNLQSTEEKTNFPKGGLRAIWQALNKISAKIETLEKKVK